MAGILADRVVAVVAELDTGLKQIGSGYLLDAGRVLTARHCVCDAVTGRPATVLRAIRASDGRSAVVTVGAASPDLDVAVLVLASDSPWPVGTEFEPVTFGRIDRSQSGVLDDCEAAGFPIWQQSELGDFRDLAEVHGQIYAMEGRERQRLVMRDSTLAGVCADAPEGQTAWSGLSGAAVFQGDLLLGVVIEHHPRQGPTALQIRPIDAVAMAGDPDSAALSGALGLRDPNAFVPAGTTSAIRHIREYLAAAVRAARHHPYPGFAQDLLPPLSAVYLHQVALRHGPRAGTDAETESVLPPALRVSAEHLMELDDDCLVIAGPGMGKTSLLRLTLLSTAREWDDGRIGTLVPVRMLATDLLDKDPLPVLMKTAAQKDLDQDDPVKSWLGGVFDRSLPPGIRWLLLVDGIDEILNANERQRVLRKLASLASPEQRTRYRVIAATRPLDDAELEAAFSAGEWSPLGFGLQPFSEEDIRDFARSWFTARHLPDPDREASRFVAEVARAKRTALAGTPLMATMLCQIHAARAADSSRRLPGSRGAIYQEFTGLLQQNVLEPHAHERKGEDYAGILELARSALGKSDSEAAERAVQAADGLQQLIAHLAAERRGGNNAPAIEIVATAPLGRKPPGIQPDRWRDYLHALLLRSGMLDTRGGDFVFLHRTLMDYLTARYSPDRAAIIRRILSVGESGKRVAWSLPREDPSFISFLLDPGSIDPADQPGGAAAVITSSEIETLLLRLYRAGIGNRFLAEQIRLGTSIPAPVRDELSQGLTRTAESALRGSVQAARTLSDIDYEAGIDLLESLALNEKLHGRRSSSKADPWDAVREVVALDRARGIDLLRSIASTRFRSSPAVAARLLAQLDPAAGTAALTSLALRNFDSDNRLAAAKSLTQLDPLVSRRTLRAIARTGNYFGTAEQTEAARALAELDPAAGIECLTAVTGSAIAKVRRYKEIFEEGRDTEEEAQKFREELREAGWSRREIREIEGTADKERKRLLGEAETAIRALAEADRDHAVSLLAKIASARGVPGRDREWITDVVREVRAGGREDTPAAANASNDTDLLANIDSRWLKKQLDSLRRNVYTGQAVRIMDQQDLPQAPSLPAELVPGLEHPAATGILSAVTRDGSFTDTERLTAMIQLAKLRDPQAADLLAAYAQAKRKTMWRGKAIEVLALIDLQRAVQVVESLADWNFFDYLLAIDHIGKVDQASAIGLRDAAERGTSAWRLVRRLSIWASKR